MIQELFKLDYRLFFFINGKFHNDLLDLILPFFRNKFFWSPLYLFIIAFLLLNFRKKGIIIILSMILAVTISDQLSSSIIKPIFHRDRPCNDIYLQEYVRQLVSCGNGFSFPSSHASNHFAIAILFSFLFFQKYKWIFPLSLLWAGSIAYSQVYVGVHYPSDILAGAICGSLIGLLMGFWCNRTIVLLSKKNNFK